MRRTPHMLRFLGIPFDNRWDFWQNNAAELEYLYVDFLKKSKEVKRRLHPDRGGDGEAFARFNKFCLMVTNAFRNHGIDRLDPIIILQEKEDRRTRQRAKSEFIRTSGRR